MLLCGVDFETTGLDVQNDRIIEFGAVIWDTTRQCPVLIHSGFVNPEREISEEITKLTGITNEDIEMWGFPAPVALAGLIDFMREAEAVVAHNGLGFDKPLLEAEVQRHHLTSVYPLLPWIDTSVDVDYPESIKTRKLVHLAAEHGFLNPFAHRAVADVLTMLRILSHYDAATVLATSQIPNVKLLAMTKKPWEDAAPEGRKEIDKAKARGFRYDGSTKQWVKNVKQNRVAEEMAHGEFAVVEAR